MPLPGRVLSGLKVLFVCAMVAAFAAAISPLAVKTGVDNGDKILHMLAFFGLTLLAAAAYPRARLVVLLLGMSAFGGLIEIAQGLPVIGRDRDVVDWIADTAASAAALAPLLLVPWRVRWLGGATSMPRSWH